MEKNKEWTSDLITKITQNRFKSNQFSSYVFGEKQNFHINGILLKSHFLIACYTCLILVVISM